MNPLERVTEVPPPTLLHYNSPRLSSTPSASGCACARRLRRCWAASGPFGGTLIRCSCSHGATAGLATAGWRAAAMRVQNKRVGLRNRSAGHGRGFFLTLLVVLHQANSGRLWSVFPGLQSLTFDLFLCHKPSAANRVLPLQFHWCAQTSSAISTAAKTPVMTAHPGLTICSELSLTKPFSDGVHDLDCFGKLSIISPPQYYCRWRPGHGPSVKTYTLLIRQASEWSRISLSLSLRMMVFIHVWPWNS